MRILNLNETWNVRKRGETETIPATVPGCIHTDLLAAGKIEDPFYRDHEDHLRWIGDTDWVYSRTFAITPEMLAEDRLVLRCEGLDTLATLTLNDVEIGQTDNQFRTYEFEVKPYLHVGENTLEIGFASTMPLIAAEQQKHYLNAAGAGTNRIDGSNRIRKSQCNYGWDWGPMCVTAGIWRPINLLAFSTARLTNLHIRQDHSHHGRVALDITVNAESTTSAPLTAAISVWHEKKQITAETIAVLSDKAHVRLIIDNPQLWWLNDLGKQPLYDVQTELRNDANLLDTCSKRIGLRTLTLDRHADQWGESFQFVINGVPFFAKGANWIPADTFVTRVSPQQYEQLIRSAADAHFNMLRVWGGGIYEDDRFYELCDQYGIAVWQELMFSCSAYAIFDEAFTANVQREIEENVVRLRHHPSLALWCGNNELEHLGNDFLSDVPEPGKLTWAEYLAYFDHALPAIIRPLDPERAYIPSSSHSPVGDRKIANNPACGDAHLWEVWHGKKPFEWYRACTHRFNSEFGFQSFPEPAVVQSYTAPEDRNITSYIMERHQRSDIGNSTIIEYMLSWFKLPTSFDMTLWLSQILQGMAMKYAVEHWRRSMPRGMGTLYWQFNDCWPVASWSSVDYYGNWKALHYMAQEFYAPLLISGVEDAKTGAVEVHVTSDRLQPVSSVAHWTLTDTDGATLASGQLAAEIAPCANHKIETLHLAEHLAQHGARRLLLWLELLVDGAIVSRNLVYFARPKHLELQEPKLTAHVQQSAENIFTATITAERPALWAWIEIPGVQASYSRRFFPVRPGMPETVTIQPKTAMTLAEIEQALHLYSLVSLTS